MDLHCIPSASPTLQWVAALANARGWQVGQAREDVCPVLELPSSWDDYLRGALSKKQRHELRRKVRRAEGQADVQWSWVHDLLSLEDGLANFFALHRASDPDKHAFMDDRMGGFFRAVARSTAQRDWLRLSVLRLNSQPVASYMCFDYRGERLVYNSGFDPSAYRELAPGIVLLAYLIADAIQHGMSRFDFLQGDERYKYDLGARDTDVMRVLVTR
jgi:CelD/BcsL family acetyltransferase involved in cellulose biosynthesis